MSAYLPAGRVAGGMSMSVACRAVKGPKLLGREQDRWRLEQKVVEIARILDKKDPERPGLPLDVCGWSTVSVPQGVCMPL